MRLLWKSGARRLSRIVLVAAVCWVGGGALAESAERPNIVFIFTDDQAPWATGITDPLDNAITPNMDRLMRTGAELTRCYTPTPVCSPARTTLMTSQYGTEMGITDWIHPNREPDLGVPPEEVMWSEVLNEAGYSTGLIGKWHLGTRDEHLPTRNGFDYFMGFRTGGRPPENPSLEERGEGVEASVEDYEGLTVDILADHALAYLDRAAAKDRPFLLCWNTRAPHRRWLPVADEDWAPYADPYTPKIPNPDFPGLKVDQVKRWTREYLASVRSVDRNIGRVMQRLRDLGVNDNTVVIFASDHGYNMGHNGTWHKGNGHWIVDNPPEATENIPQGQRPNLWDNSIYVPAAIRWPGVIEPGQVIEEQISFLDFYPTLLAIARVDPPEDVTIRGRNFLPLLKGDEIDDWRSEFYLQYSTHHQSRTHMRGWRTEEWKLVRDFLNPGRDELYDLRRDPHEARNLMEGDRPEAEAVVERLHGKIVERMREIDDPALEHVEAD